MDSASKDKSKRQARSARVDDVARNERQKLTLLVEHSHILADISKKLGEDNRDLVGRTKKLIARSKKSVNKVRSG